MSRIFCSPTRAVSIEKHPDVHRLNRPGGENVERIVQAFQEFKVEEGLTGLFLWRRACSKKRITMVGIGKSAINPIEIATRVK